MQQVTPQVFHVSQTICDDEGIQAYMNAVGVPDWITDAPSDAEKLIEVMGRGCYRSFAPGLNKNISKIREGNRQYTANILDSKHGSVLEHAGDGYIFLNVSRVFTHELVRNRVGNAFSQESLRYVRLDALKCWFPTVFENHPKRDQIFALWSAKFRSLEEGQVELAQLLDLDTIKDFKTKKKLTSAMRRLAPIGLATMIGYSGNHRSIRWAIEQRTSEAAEEEMRLVFGEVFDEQLKRYPNLYQDAKIELVDGLRQISFENYKV
jgi:thymidylate synthase (FAD)